MNAAIGISIAVLSFVALVLAVLLLLRFLRERRIWHLYWGIGIFLVFVTLVEESALYFGVWSQLLIRSYLVLVAVLVGVLSLGSAELSLKGWWRSLWFGYVGLTSAACAVVCVVSSVPSSIMFGGVVWGLPTADIVITSSLVTIPSALLLIGSSLYGAIRHRRFRLLYIALGTAIISVAGTLYIVSFPASLYYAEFAGVLLLFFGFVNVLPPPVPSPQPAPAG